MDEKQKDKTREYMLEQLKQYYKQIDDEIYREVYSKTPKQYYVKDIRNKRIYTSYGFIIVPRRRYLNISTNKQCYLFDEKLNLRFKEPGQKIARYNGYTQDFIDNFVELTVNQNLKLKDFRHYSQTPLSVSSRDYLLKKKQPKVSRTTRKKLPTLPDIKTSI